MNQNTFHKTKKLIKQFEGFSPQVYTCAGGFQTIGYGHQLRPQENLLQSITQAEADYLLDQDLHLMAPAVSRLITVALTPNQWIALISFTFNVGPAALQRSTLRLKVNRKEHYDVPEEFLKWIFSKGQKCLGLMHRRQIEANIYQAKGEIK